MSETIIPRGADLSPSTVQINLPNPAPSRSKLGNPVTSLPNWRSTYADASGHVTVRPSYPDTSYLTFVKSGGNLLGIGYAAWKDRLIQDYNTAVAAYEDWYNSAPQQVERIRDAGLSTNLAYGQASPGSAGNTSVVSPSGSTPGEVFSQGAGIVASLFTNLKTLGEAAAVINALPESRFKGNLAKQLDVAAAAGSINNEAGYMAQLYGARTLLGVGKSKAAAESVEAAFSESSASAEKQLLESLTSRDANGNPSDFGGSLFVSGRSASLKNAIVEYKSNKKRFDKLFSDDRYWEATISKMVADSYISESEAWRLKTIREDPNMGNAEKCLAMEKGLPGFISRLSFFMSSGLLGLFTGGIPFNSPPMR